MSAYLAQLRAFYEGLDERRRRLLLGAVAAAVVAIAAVGAWSSYVQYQTLSRGSDPTDISEMAAALEAAGIPYRVDDLDLKVPAGQLGAAHGVVGGVGRLVPPEMSSSSVVGSPDVVSYNLRRSNEMRLAAAISRMEGVVDASVQITPGSQAVFLGDDRPAKASVYLRMRRGQVATSSQAHAIAALVAGAVEGLDPGAVAITDGQGHLLADGVGGAGDPADDLLAQAWRRESAYERKITNNLLSVLGFGGDFTVAASVELDPTEVAVEKLELDVEKPATTSEWIDESESNSTAPQGTPGVDANVPERAGPTSTADRNQARNTIKSTNMFGDTKTVTRREAGDVKRVSVAVQVNEARLLALATAEGGEVDDARVAEIKAQIEEATRAAVGFLETRGDVVTVTYVPFAPVVEEADEALTLPPIAESTLPYAIAALGLGLAFLLVVRPLVNAAVNPAPPAAAEPDEAPADDEEQAPAEDPKEIAARLARQESTEIATRLRILVDNFQPVDSGDLNRLVKHESEAAAQVLRLWNR